ncbi:archease [Gemmatimonadota bacterium]
MPDPDIPVVGVTGLEHTADVGLEVAAPSLPELFVRAALGAMWLVLEREGKGEDVVVRSVELAENDLAALMRSWLRTLLFWLETEGLVVLQVKIGFLPVPRCSGPEGQAFGLRAQVTGCLDQGPHVREVKGVTLHGLAVERTGEEWVGRVIFDV